jgi:hypothetical protein
VSDSVNVISPAGELGNIPGSAIQEAIKHGYRPATQEEVQQAERKEQYGTGFGNELAAGVEGGLSGATFGLSRWAETEASKVLGLESLSPEAQAARKEFNPWASGVGEVAGIGGSLLFAPGASLPGLLGKGAAKAGAEVAAGLTERAAAQKIIGGTVAGAIEGMAYGTAPVISEAALGDPTLTAQKAFHQIGLGALLGGGIGAVASSLGAFARKPILQATEAEVGVAEGVSYRESLLSKRVPSNSMVEPSIPSPGLETNLPPSSTITREPGAALESSRYVAPSQLYSLDDLSDIHLNYNKVAELSKANEPAFTADLQRATGLSPNVRIKGKDSFLGKLDRYAAANKDPSEIADNLAGRIVIEQPDIGQQINNIRNNFKVTEVSDFFEKPTDWGYQGVNIRVELPNGLPAEIQIHTPESVSGATKIHKLYEKWRNLDWDKLSEAQLAEKEADRLASVKIAQGEVTPTTIPTSDQAKIAKRIGGAATPEDVAHYQANMSRVDASPRLATKLDPAETGIDTLEDRMREAYEGIHPKLKTLGEENKAAILTAGITKDAEELAQIVDDNIEKMVKVKVPGEETTKAIARLQKKAQQIRDAGGEFSAQDIKDTIDELDVDLEPFYTSKIGKGTTKQERALLGLRRDISDSLKEEMKAAGFPEYETNLAEMHKLLDVRQRVESHFQADTWYQRAVRALEKNEQRVASGRPLVARGTKQGTSYYDDMIDLGNTSGMDFQTMYKDRAVLGRLFPDKAQGMEKGSAFLQLLRNTARMAAHPTEIPGKVIGAGAEILTGETPELIQTLQRKMGQNALLNQSVTQSTARSIVDKMKGAAGSKLFGGRAGSLGIPMSVTFAELLDQTGNVADAEKKMDVLLSLERAAQKADKQTDRYISNLFSGNGKHEVPEKLNEMVGLSSKEQADEFEKLSQDAAQLANDPTMLTEKLSTALAGVNDHAPNVAVGLNMSAVRALTFLNQKLMQIQPQDPRMPFDHKYVPSKDKLYSLAKTMSYLNTPFSVLKELSTGMMSKEGKEVLQTVYPEYYTELKGKVLAGVAEHQAKGKGLPVKAQLAISFFTDQPMSSGMTQRAIASNQAIFAMPQQNTAPRAASAKHLELSGRYETPLQKIASK